MRKDEYSSGGTVRSVPGLSKSRRRGDWPDDALEDAVVLVCLVLILSAPNKLCDPKDSGANDSTGDIDWDEIRKGDG